MSHKFDSEYYSLGTAAGLSIYSIYSFRSRRKPDLVVDPGNIKVRSSNFVANSTANNQTQGALEDRFSVTSLGQLIAQKKCGLQVFMERIYGGEICTIDEFPWAALLLYETSARHFWSNRNFD